LSTAVGSQAEDEVIVLGQKSAEFYNAFGKTSGNPPRRHLVAGVGKKGDQIRTRWEQCETIFDICDFLCK
jgi:hypothetical protein